MQFSLISLFPSLTRILPFLLTFSVSTASQNFHDRNLATVNAIYAQNLYPTNLGFLRNQTVPQGLFDKNATGRITPLGNFTGFDESTEYFFALSPVPTAPLYQAFIKAEVVAYQSECAQVASSIVWLTLGVYNPGAVDHLKEIAVLKQVAFWYFTPTGAVLRYDAYIPSLRPYVLSTTPSIGPSQSRAQNSVISTSLCPAIQAVCGTNTSSAANTTNPNAQYPSLTACVSILSSKPFGDWDKVWTDSVVCRLVHVKLADVNPGLHCPHVGPNGGGKCVDEGYIDGGYFADEELWGLGLGEAFRCEEGEAREGFGG